MTLKASILSLCAICFVTLASAQIKAVEKFVESHKGIQKFFIYQSSLRMLNQDGDEDFNRLIKDVRKINVYIAEDNADVSQAGFQKMLRELSADQFETLVSVKEGQMRMNLLGKESGSRAWYVLAGNEGSSFVVLEMDGKLDLRYLQSIEDVDLDKLRKIVGMEENEEHQEDESPKH